MELRKVTEVSNRRIGEAKLIQCQPGLIRSLVCSICFVSAQPNVVPLAASAQDLTEHGQPAREGDPASPGEFPINGPSVARFGSKSDSSKILSTVDHFLSATSRFDRESRLGVTNDPSIKDLVAFIDSQIVEWTDSEKQKVGKLLVSIRDRLENFQLPLPDVILLVKTTGSEEGNAAYCRKNAVVLPSSYLRMPEPQLERVLLHELFHVVSSHASRQVRDLYPVIGFEPIEPIELPASLKDLKITNPDAPAINCTIELKVGDESVHAAPVLVAKSNYDPQRERSFFRYLQFRLMVVERAGDSWRGVERDGNVRLLDPNEIKQFKQKIGDNTKYILHPEEILADNFVHAVLDSPNLPNPEIVARVKDQFLKK